MRTLLTILGLTATLLTAVYSPKAKAADNITHLYTSTLVAAAAGIDMNYALTLGMGNEMIDRGLWSTPMGMPTPRLLFHFLGTPVNFTVNEGGLKKGLALATIDHPLFYNLLDKGLKSKNPVFLGAALHLLIDTYYHAGYSNLLGHGEGGHRPDMPYDEVEKAKLCLQSIIELNYLIRDMLPSEKRDYSVMNRIIADVTKDEAFAKLLIADAKVGSLVELQAEVSRNPHLMFRIFMEHNNFRNAVFTNMEKTDQYFRLAMEHLFKQFKAEGTVSLEESHLGELAHVFKDIIARTDVDPMESFKIFVYRVLQMQDPVLKEMAQKELVGLGYDYEKLAAILEKGQFDFSDALGLDKKSDISVQIDSNSQKNMEAIKYVAFGVEDLIRRISVRNADGTTRLLKVHEWSQEAHTYAGHVLPEMMSWMTVLDSEGELRQIEHRDIGKIFSTQTDVEAAKRIIDRFPNYLTENLMALRSLNQNPEKAYQIARLKALSEVAAHVSHNATKDLFPGKLGPTKKVIYEDDSLPHAKFAKESRVNSMQSLLARLTGVVIASEPQGFHVYLKEKLLSVLRVFKLAKVKEVFPDEKMKEIEMLKREHMLGLGLASRDEDGNIIMDHEKKTLIDANGKEMTLTKANPNLTFRGYRKWTAMTFKYAGRLMFMTKRAKNKAILAYVENGKKTKSEVVRAISSYYKVENQSFVEQLKTKYGTLPENGAALDVTGLILKCEALFK